MLFFAKTLELIGITNLAFALYQGIFKASMRNEYAFFFIGSAIFAIGWLIQRQVEKK